MRNKIQLKDLRDLPKTKYRKMFTNLMEDLDKTLESKWNEWFAKHQGSAPEAPRSVQDLMGPEDVLISEGEVTSEEEIMLEDDMEDVLEDETEH